MVLDKDHRLFRIVNPKSKGLYGQTRENQWRGIVIDQFYKKNGN